MDFIPATNAEVASMLETIGVDSIDRFFEPIPEAVRAPQWALPRGESEMAVRARGEALAARNETTQLCFLGGGYYDHFIPAAVDAISGRSEFYTAYTPYQPECSQGALQSIYEYQSAVCRLTGMEYANASLYDGGTALFEAVTMAMRATRRSKVLLHASLNPRYVEMLKTHAAFLDLEWAEGEPDETTACVVAQNPAFLGDAQDFTALAGQCHTVGALFVLSCYPVSLGVLKTPGEMGADIAVAEGQSLGLPLGFGGPYLGLLATHKEFLRKMPGRLVGATEDTQGRRGFVLTLQAREQHIRREKAMSNICSNQALCALRALTYLCLLGKEGLRELAVACHSKAEYLKGQLGFAEMLNPGPTFNEFAVRLPIPAEKAVLRMRERGFLAGLPLASLNAGGENDLLIAVTERRTREEMDRFAQALKEVAWS